MIQCAFCGRANDEASRFCIDCGKPINPAAARVQPAVAGKAAAATANVAGAAPPNSAPAYSPSRPPAAAPPPSTRVDAPAVAGRSSPCPHCGKLVDSALPFCPSCGKRTGLSPAPGTTCSKCGGPVSPGNDTYCPRCGTRVPVPAQKESSTTALSASTRETGGKLALLSETGEVAKTYSIHRSEMVIGRLDGDIRFESDVYMSPVHAQLTTKDGEISIRDLGSRNGTWVFLDAPCRLTDGDIVLVGSQILRFRRLGYPGPNPPEADATRRLGSLTPTADIAVVQQLRSDGSTRDTFHLSPGRSVIIGREQGDWVFPYDQTMSGRHAEIRSEDMEFVISDAGSRNGVAVAVRGERNLKRGNRLLLGDQILRVESV